MRDTETLAGFTAAEPSSGGYWLWSEGGNSSPVQLLLTSDGTEVESAFEAEKDTPQYYWEQTSTDQESMPGLWKKVPPITDLGAAVISTLGGVGACSPEHYQAALEQIAKMCHREVTDEFKKEVREVLGSMPCPLD